MVLKDPLLLRVKYLEEPFHPDAGGQSRNQDVWKSQLHSHGLLLKAHRQPARPRRRSQNCLPLSRARAGPPELPGAGAGGAAEEIKKSYAFSAREPFGELGNRWMMC